MKTNDQNINQNNILCLRLTYCHNNSKHNIFQCFHSLGKIHIKKLRNNFYSRLIEN